MSRAESRESSAHGSVQPDDPTRTTGFLKLPRHRIQQDPSTAAEIKRRLDARPVPHRSDHPLRHVVPERHGGVEKVRRREEQTHGGERSHCSEESGGESGGGGGGAGEEEGVEEEADGVEVEEEEGGEEGESDGVEEEEEESVFLLDPVNGVDLSPISRPARLPH